MSLLLQRGQQAWSGSVPGKVGSMATLCKTTWTEATGPETSSALQTQQTCQLTCKGEWKGPLGLKVLRTFTWPSLSASSVEFISGHWVSLHLFRVQCLCLQPSHCVSFLQHFCWMSSLEILSQGQFLPLITDSLVLQCLFPQFLTVPVSAPGPAGTRTLFPPPVPPGISRSAAASGRTRLCAPLALSTSPLCSEHSSFFIPLPQLYSLLIFPSPFLWKFSYVPSEALMPPQFNYILIHLLAWTQISIGRSSLHPDEASPQLDHPTFIPK